MLPPLTTLNSPDALRDRELAVYGQRGIRWKVVSVNGRFARGRKGEDMDRALVTLRSVPNGTVSGMAWAELKARLIKGELVIL